MPHVYHTEPVVLDGITVNSVEVTSDTGSESLKTDIGHLSDQQQIQFLNECNLHNMHLRNTRKGHSLITHEHNYYEVETVLKEISISELVDSRPFSYGTWVKFDFNGNTIKFDPVEFTGKEKFNVHELLDDNICYYSIPFLFAIKNYFGSQCSLEFKVLPNHSLSFKVINTEKQDERLGLIYNFSYDPPNGNLLLIGNGNTVVQ
ncbi:hypothetical protein LX97_02267 [Nonlabens dokdonensis]|uniref:Uncharacterized protein n=2 Tax=Nonlabens dokdonensis TaxID=328515 RepID=L7WBE9_NONDD|nr:hypothetical protein [Nonlabens dokdonensis]AGC77537.1 hypothetical protein DDD_2410 [Nonlabens dokdonensis DSW-6]PZX39909.1 hypothetical protein LX97_02267 [Nonlabens dokdonensis]